MERLAPPTVDVLLQLRSTRSDTDGGEIIDMKHTVDVFSAGCAICKETIEEIEKLDGAECVVSVHDMHHPPIANLAKQYSIDSVPAVVIDGKLVSSGRNVGLYEQVREALSNPRAGDGVKPRPTSAKRLKIVTDTTPYRLWSSGKNRFGVTHAGRALPILGYVSLDPDNTWRAEHRGKILHVSYPSIAEAAQALIDLAGSDTK